MKRKVIITGCLVILILIVSVQDVIAQTTKTKESVGLFPVNVNGKFGYIDKSGNEIIPPQFDYAGNFSEGLAPVSILGKWGFIDKTGTIIINLLYTDVGKFSEGVAPVMIGGERNVSMQLGRQHYIYFDFKTEEWILNGKWGYIDKHGNYKINPQYDLAFEFHEGLALIMTYELVSELHKDGVSYYGASKYGYIDKNGKIVIDVKYDDASNFSEGLASVKLEHEKYFINKTNSFIVNLSKFDNVWSLSQGLSKVQKDYKCGYINKYGKIVIKMNYDNAGMFSEGLAPVNIGAYLDYYMQPAGGKWGYIDTTGTTIIVPQYDEANEFCNGLAKVKIKSINGYIDKNNNFIWFTKE